eukprot:7944625-Prorocentrum_lima.AAC.1
MHHGLHPLGPGCSDGPEPLRLPVQPLLEVAPGQHLSPRMHRRPVGAVLIHRHAPFAAPSRCRT